MGIEVLIGVTLSRCDVHSNEIDFYTEDKHYRMYHEQSCCERVYVEDVCGDITDLLNTPIVVAEERTSKDRSSDDESYYESATWTFYELRTIKGSVTLRWCGTSNGYYSESVTFSEVYKYEND